MNILPNEVIHSVRNCDITRRYECSNSLLGYKGTQVDLTALNMLSNPHQLKDSMTTTKSRSNWALPCCDKHHHHHGFFLLWHHHHHPSHSSSLVVFQMRLQIQYQAMIQVLNQVPIQVLILTPKTLILNLYVFAYSMNHSVNLLYI